MRVIWIINPWIYSNMITTPPNTSSRKLMTDLNPVPMEMDDPFVVATDRLIEQVYSVELAEQIFGLKPGITSGLATFNGDLSSTSNLLVSNLIPGDSVTFLQLSEPPT